MARSAGIEIKGGKRLRATLRKAGIDLGDLKEAHAKAANIAANAARSRAPRGKTGRLAGSVRGAGTKTFGVIRAGFARTPYAGPIHYGWPKGSGPRGSYAGDPFITEAAQSTESQWSGIYYRALENIIDTIEGA